MTLSESHNWDDSFWVTTEIILSEINNWYDSFWRTWLISPFYPSTSVIMLLSWHSYYNPFTQVLFWYDPFTPTQWIWDCETQALWLIFPDMTDLTLFFFIQLICPFYLDTAGRNLQPILNWHNPFTMTQLAQSFYPATNGTILLPWHNW